MIKCVICGKTNKRKIDKHIRFDHGLTVPEYKLKYKAEVSSPELRLEIGERAKINWSKQEYRDKTNTAREASFTPERLEKISKAVKKAYENGFKAWNTGLTKDTDSRVALVGQKNKTHLTGRTKENYPYLAEKSEKWKEKWKNGEISPKMTQLNSSWMSPEEYACWRQKISTTISEKYRLGEIKNGDQKFKIGKYKNFNYDSGWELEFMEHLDSRQDIKLWKKDFDIIRYFDKNNNQRRYVPDFYIELVNDQTVVIELKGRDKNPEQTQLKACAARKIYSNYYICSSVKEAKEKLNEISNNSQNQQN